jgi:tetratricopeptide (TPR) repeat protein
MSVEEARREVEEKRRLYGDDHLETLDSMSLLATALRDAGKHQEARSMVEELIRTRSRLHTHDEYAIQRLSLILATVIFALGDFPSARILEEGALETFDKMSGPDSTASLTAARHLSNTLRVMSDFASLAVVEERILATLRRTLGESHRDTVQAMSRLARTRRQTSEFQAAKDLDTMVIEIAGRNGFDARMILEAKCDLFADLTLLDDYQGRVTLLLEIYEESDRTLPKGDPLRKRIDRNRKFVKPLLRTAKKSRKFSASSDDEFPQLHIPDTL